MAELIRTRSIETVELHNAGQKLPERVNHYVTDGEIVLASLLVSTRDAGA